MTKEQYQEYLKTPHWKELRKRKLKQQKYTCEVCDCKFHLQVHHLTYERLGHERLKDLAVLCPKCHKLIHGLMDKRKKVKEQIAKEIAIDID